MTEFEKIEQKEDNCPAVAAEPRADGTPNKAKRLARMGAAFAFAGGALAVMPGAKGHSSGGHSSGGRSSSSGSAGRSSSGSSSGSLGKSLGGSPTGSSSSSPSGSGSGSSSSSSGSGSSSSSGSNSSSGTGSGSSSGSSSSGKSGSSSGSGPSSSRYGRRYGSTYGGTSSNGYGGWFWRYGWIGLWPHHCYHGVYADDGEIGTSENADGSRLECTIINKTITTDIEDGSRSVLGVAFECRNVSNGVVDLIDLDVTAWQGDAQLEEVSQNLLGKSDSPGSLGVEENQAGRTWRAFRLVGEDTVTLVATDGGSQGQGNAMAPQQVDLAGVERR